MKKAIFILVILSFNQLVSAQSNGYLNLTFEVYNANTKQSISASEGVTAEVNSLKFNFGGIRSSFVTDITHFTVETFNETNRYTVDGVVKIFIKNPITFTIKLSGPGYESISISDTFCITQRGEHFLGENFRGYVSDEKPKRGEIANVLIDKAILCDCKYNNIIFPIYLKPKDSVTEDISDTFNRKQ